MTIYNWLSLFGIPGIISLILGSIIKSLKKQKADTDAVKLGIQALLRSQMIDDYNHYIDKGYAPIYARESFENVWKQYEALGANGVMEDLHKKFMTLPTQGDELYEHKS